MTVIVDAAVQPAIQYRGYVFKNMPRVGIKGFGVWVTHNADGTRYESGRRVYPLAANDGQIVVPGKKGPIFSGLKEFYPLMSSMREAVEYEEIIFAVSADEKGDPIASPWGRHRDYARASWLIESKTIYRLMLEVGRNWPSQYEVAWEGSDLSEFFVPAPSRPNRDPLDFQNSNNHWLEQTSDGRWVRCDGDPRTGR